MSTRGVLGTSGDGLVHGAFFLDRANVLGYIKRLLEKEAFPVFTACSGYLELRGFHVVRGVNDLRSITCLSCMLAGYRWVENVGDFVT